MDRKVSAKVSFSGGIAMHKRVGIGCQDFEDIRRNGNFYVDKTCFIREWWEQGDSVTLITRPRRFGKTLNMSMLEKFFSVEYAGRGDLFEGLEIWREEKYRKLQGTYPVIALSFADVKEVSFIQAKKTICRIIKLLYDRFDFLLNSNVLSESEKSDFRHISVDMESNEAAFSLKALSLYLYRCYGKKVLILLDEYDTPMQEAYTYGYWEELAGFTRSLFNAAFKTNPYLERGIMTGITRISKESMFSDLNNLEVVTIISDKYSGCFGFTEEEVFEALEEFGLKDRKEEVKQWYDGFSFGCSRDVYNPWSIINYLDKKQARPYWVNTSSNALAGKLIREGSSRVKMTMEALLRGESYHTVLDEQIVFLNLDKDPEAIWSLFLASGYLKAEHAKPDPDLGKVECDLKIVNREVRAMFLQLIDGWFAGCQAVGNAFLQAMFSGEVEEMNEYMNEISCELFSSFDTGGAPDRTQPERFYHGFVLGLMVELRDKYVITSNRESGLGRYDIMLEPKKGFVQQDAAAIIIEFKVVREKRGETMESAVESALKQIEEKNYQAALVAKGIEGDRIRKYGFAFCGKKVLIGEAF